eukprot:1892487-Prymnesium_polylepis.3
MPDQRVGLQVHWNGVLVSGSSPRTRGCPSTRDRPRTPPRLVPETPECAEQTARDMLCPVRA